MNTRTNITCFFVLIFLLIPGLGSAKMEGVSDEELAGIAGKSGMDIVVDLGASIGNFRYSDNGYIEFGGIVIVDGAGNSATLGTFGDPFTFDIVGRRDDDITDGFWEWDDGTFDDDWDWTPGSVPDTNGIGPHLALVFPFDPANIEPITIKINTLNFNGRYIGTQVDTSATAADTLTDLEIKGAQLNYLDDSTSSHLYIASSFCSNPRLTYTSNTNDYTDADYESAINIDDGDANYPGDGAFDGDQDIAATGHPELIPDQNLVFDQAGGIFIVLALQAKISEILYTNNPQSSYLKMTNLHMFEDFSTAYNNEPNTIDWPAMTGALKIGAINEPLILDVIGGTTPHISLNIPIKGCIRIEKVELNYVHSTDTNYDDYNNFGPIFLDILQANGVSADGIERYIKIEIPTTDTITWNY